MKNALIIILFTLSTVVSATTYHIDPAGADGVGRNGTTQPWLTLAYACTRVRTSGNIIHVNAGTYIETGAIYVAVGVSIEGDGVTSIIHSHYAANYTIFLLSASKCTNGNQHISNIKMDGDALTAFGAIQVKCRSNVEIYNCTFVDFNNCGVSFYGALAGSEPVTYAKGNKFHDNIMTNCGGAAVGGTPISTYSNLGINGQEGMLVYNNTITQLKRGADTEVGQCIKAVPGWHKGLKIYNNILYRPYDGSSWDFTIELWGGRGGCEIYDNIITGGIDACGMGIQHGRPVQQTKGTYDYAVWIHDNIIQAYETSRYIRTGVVFEAGVNNAIIERNHFKNLNKAVYIPMHYCNVSNVNIRYNIFENIGVTDDATPNGTPSCITWAITLNDARIDSIKIWNNTMIGHIGTKDVAGITLPMKGIVTNFSIRNNIIKDFNYAPVYTSNAGTLSIDVMSIENNNFYQNGNSNLPRYVNITPAHITTQNNIISNPLFVSSSDFHLQVVSPAICKGLKITGITTDYDGNTMRDPPSIGAYEYYSNPTSPFIPAYQSSVVENATPARLEMTYNLSLANIVPAASAFTVRANSVARTVNSVAVSGTKVLLILASAVVYGDVVTVAYTKPSTNPLQTTPGRQAASISPQTVTNKVSPSITGQVNRVNRYISPVDTEEKKIKIYPNPAHDFFNISFEDPTLIPQIIKLIDLSGRVFLEDYLNPGVNNIPIPKNLKTGVYIVYLLSGSLILYTQKLIINK